MGQRALFLGFLVCVLLPASVSAQPQLALSTTVAVPAESVSVTIAVTFLGAVDIQNGMGTITGTCGALPAGVIANFHMTAIKVDTIHQ